jgi:hypothetical protein
LEPSVRIVGLLCSTCQEPCQGRIAILRLPPFPSPLFPPPPVSHTSPPPRLSHLPPHFPAPSLSHIPLSSCRSSLTIPRLGSSPHPELCEDRVTGRQKPIQRNALGPRPRPTRAARRARHNRPGRPVLENGPRSHAVHAPRTAEARSRVAGLGAPREGGSVESRNRSRKRSASRRSAVKRRARQNRPGRPVLEKM